MNIKPKIKTYSAMFCVLTTVALLCGGCMTTNEEKLHREVATWVPAGTSAEEAKRIMEGQGFRCVPGHIQSGIPWEGPVLLCRRENRVLNKIWDVRLYLKDNRVVGSDARFAMDLFRFSHMH